MQLTLSDYAAGFSPASSSGRTSPASSAPMTMPSAAFWQDLPAKGCRSNRQGVNGRTLVVCLDPGAVSRGGCSTHNISDCPNGGDASSLSHLLETAIPQKYYLSDTAKQGILRRTESRGKKLPPLLQAALAATAEAAA